MRDDLIDLDDDVKIKILVWKKKPWRRTYTVDFLDFLKNFASLWLVPGNRQKQYIEIEQQKNVEKTHLWWYWGGYGCDL